MSRRHHDIELPFIIVCCGRGKIQDVTLSRIGIILVGYLNDLTFLNDDDE
jgi:hypothetical protein